MGSFGLFNRFVKIYWILLMKKEPLPIIAIYFHVGKSSQSQFHFRRNKKKKKTVTKRNFFCNGYWIKLRVEIEYKFRHFWTNFSWSPKPVKSFFFEAELTWNVPCISIYIVICQNLVCGSFSRSRAHTNKRFTATSVDGDIPLAFLSQWG